MKMADLNAPKSSIMQLPEKCIEMNLSIKVFHNSFCMKDITIFMENIPEIHLICNTPLKAFKIVPTFNRFY